MLTPALCIMNFLNEKINTMKHLYLLFLLGALHTFSFAQDNPAINTWMINTTGITGSHYIDGNPTPVIDTAQANVQKVQYSANYSYINCSGVPSYIIGPYLDGNPALATNNGRGDGTIGSSNGKPRPLLQSI